MNTHKKFKLVAGFLLIAVFALGAEVRGQSSITAVNAINYLPEVTADSFVAVFSGAEITTQTASNPLGAIELGGVTAALDGQSIPLVFVSGFQVNLRIPEGVAPGRRTLTLSGEAGQKFTGPVTVIAHTPKLATFAKTNDAAAVYLNLGVELGLFFGEGVAVRMIPGQPQTGTVKLVLADGREFQSFYSGPSALPVAFQQFNFAFLPGDLAGEPMARLCVLPDGGALKCSNEVRLKR